MQVKVNLLLKEELEKNPAGKFLKWVLSYGRYIIVGVELIVLIVFFSRFIYDRRLTDLNESIEQKQAIVTSASELEKDIRDLQEKTEKIRTLEEERLTYLETLEKLKEITPQEVIFKNLSFQEEKISLFGQTLFNNSFAQLLASLKNAEQFSEIELSEIKKNEETGLIEFQIEAKIN